MSIRYRDYERVFVLVKDSIRFPERGPKTLNFRPDLSLNRKEETELKSLLFKYTHFNVRPQREVIYGRDSMHKNRDKFFFKGDDVRLRDDHSVRGTVAATPQHEWRDTVLVCVEGLRKSPIRYKQDLWEKI